MDSFAVDRRKRKVYLFVDVRTQKVKEFLGAFVAEHVNYMMWPYARGQWLCRRLGEENKSIPCIHVGGKITATRETKSIPPPQKTPMHQKGPPGNQKKGEVRRAIKKSAINKQ